MCKTYIREVDKPDLEACISVIRNAFITVAEDFGLTRQNCPTNRAFIELVHLEQDYSKGNMMYGLVSGEEIVGFMQLELGQDECYHLKNVAVVPESRHMGYGKALLDYAKAKVHELGGNILKISIIEDNIVLKNWYIENGFIPAGTKKYENLPFTVGLMQTKIR